MTLQHLRWQIGVCVLVGITAVSSYGQIPGASNLLPNPVSGLPGADRVVGQVQKKVEAKLLAETVDQVGILIFRIELKMASISQNLDDTQLVQRVSNRIVEAAKRSKYGDVAKALQWETKLIESDDVNAFAVPGGKIGVDTALLRFIRDRDYFDKELAAKEEDLLAAALAHEVVHALARHAAEAIQREAPKVLELAARGKQLSEQGLDPKTTAALMGAVGIVHGVAVTIPFVRTQESEADQVGLQLMAQAGYDPQVAISFWQKHQGLAKGKKALQFLSLHPSDEARIAQMKSWLPEALKQYKHAREDRPSTRARG